MASPHYHQIALKRAQGVTPRPKKPRKEEEKAGVESVLRLCTCTGIRSKRTEGRHDLVNEPLILQPRYKTITEISLGGAMLLYVPAYFVLCLELGGARHSWRNIWSELSEYSIHDHETVLDRCPYFPYHGNLFFGVWYVGIETFFETDRAYSTTVAGGLLVYLTSFFFLRNTPYKWLLSILTSCYFRKLLFKLLNRVVTLVLSTAMSSHGSFLFTFFCFRSFRVAFLYRNESPP